mgnify:CR=1 FL=1
MFGSAQSLGTSWKRWRRVSGLWDSGPLLSRGLSVGEESGVDLVDESGTSVDETGVDLDEAGTGVDAPESFIGKVVSEFGASRIAWGSNYPASSGVLPDMLAEAKAALAFLPQRAEFENMARE